MRRARRVGAAVGAALLGTACEGDDLLTLTQTVVPGDPSRTALVVIKARTRDRAATVGDCVQLSAPGGLSALEFTSPAGDGGDGQPVCPTPASCAARVPAGSVRRSRR